MLEIDGESNDLACWGRDSDKLGAELDLWDQVLRDGIKVDQGRSFGEDRAFWDLVEHLGALNRVEGAIEDGQQSREAHDVLWSRKMDTVANVHSCIVMTPPIQHSEVM